MIAFGTDATGRAGRNRGYLERPLMRRARMMRWGVLVASGAVLMQTTGCLALEFLQTIFLGISAAGALAILRNL